jgi:hypothetical protein
MCKVQISRAEFERRQAHAAAQARYSHRKNNELLQLKITANEAAVTRALQKAGELPEPLPPPGQIVEVAQTFATRLLARWTAAVLAKKN